MNPIWSSRAGHPPGCSRFWELMPGWVQATSRINPLSYEVDGLRHLLIGTYAALGVDFAVLAAGLVAGVLGASALLGRLVR